MIQGTRHVARAGLVCSRFLWPRRQPLSSTSPRSEFSEQEIAQAREFLAGFNKDRIPRKICQVGFSRSSGPGGQNVNKVNSKATLKVPLNDLLAFVPAALHAEICASSYVTGRAEHLVISSDDQRKQAANTETCFDKLSDLIKDAGARAIPGVTSAETKRRIVRLEKREREVRLQAKKMHGSKKASRKSGGSGKSDY